MVRRKLSRAALLLPALAFALFPQSVQAEVLPGLVVTAYEIPPSYPVRDDETYPVCNIYVESNINQAWGGGSVGGCRADWVMLHYEGFIQIPKHESIEFMVAADDGGTVEIAGQEVGTWNLKGCSWSRSITLSVMPGEYALDGWFYEAGGNTCYMLAWNIDDEGWEIVPSWAYTTESTPTTTTSTTTVPDTTVPATTTTSTTLQETSTTTSSSVLASTSSSTTESTQTTSTSSPQESSTTSTTTSSTTSTVADTTTSTTQAPLPVWVPPATTTTEAVTTTTTSEPPTETTVTTETTQPRPSTTIPQTTVAQTSIPSTSIPDTTSSSTTLVIDTTTTMPPIQPSMSNQQILQQAINPSVVESLSTTEAEILFAGLDEESVTEDQAALIIQALDEAPDGVKKAFEENVNVFSGLWSSYKMVGQTISVAERVTLVAVANTMGAATAVLRRRNEQ